MEKKSSSKSRFRKWQKFKDPDSTTSTDKEDSGVHLEDGHVPKPWGSGDALDIPGEGYRNSPSR